MTPRPAADLLEEAVAILSRIERILTREADNATVDYYVKRLSHPRPVIAPDGMPVWPPGSLPGMPDPPLPKVQTTWESASTHASTTGTVRTGWVTPPPSYMHGRFLHGEDVMVGP